MRNTEIVKDFLHDFLSNWKEQKESEGFIPTVDLLLEEIGGVPFFPEGYEDFTGATPNETNR